MKEHEAWSSPFINSIWSDTNDTWEESHEDWRIVGTNPFMRRIPCEPINSDDNILYIIEFPSKRLDIAYSIERERIMKNEYVILEADRGEDCGTVKGYTTKDQWEEFLKKYRNIENDFKLKKIYRIATEKDLKTMKERKMMVDEALEECRQHVVSMNLQMEILDCEYQFDLNKITFFYKSDQRIDFRELVKDLYKIFKTRIWMCSVDKAVDGLLLEILRE